MASNEFWRDVFLSGGNRPHPRKKTLAQRLTQPFKMARAKLYVRGVQRRGKRRGRGR